MKKLVLLGLFLQFSPLHAGVLSFMPMHPNRPDQAKVGTPQRKITTAHVRRDFRQTDGRASDQMVLYIYDEHDVGCIIHQELVPQVDLAQLASQAVDKDISISCELTDDQTPTAHSAVEAEAVEFSIYTRPQKHF